RRHVGGVARVARDLAADMPELLQVRVARVLGGLDHERRVAARAAAAGHVVLALGLVGEREEAAEGIVGLVHQRLRDAVAADAGEAPLAVGRAEFGDEGLAVGVGGGVCEATDVERGDGGVHFGHASAAARTAPARVSRVDWTSAASSASTVTRTTGSVPEGR